MKKTKKENNSNNPEESNCTRGGWLHYLEIRMKMPPKLKVSETFFTTKKRKAMVWHFCCSRCLVQGPESFLLLESDSQSCFVLGNKKCNLKVCPPFHCHWHTWTTPNHKETQRRKVIVICSVRPLQTVSGACELLTSFKESVWCIHNTACNFPY